MAQKKAAIGALVLLLIIGGAIAFIISNKEAVFDLAMQSREEGYHEDADAAVVEERDVDPSELTEGQSDLVDIDLELALTERVIGNPDAPVKISEHSSFTCGHCGNFHKNVFEQFKTNWLDSGKAYLVFSDPGLRLRVPQPHKRKYRSDLPQRLLSQSLSSS